MAVNNVILAVFRASFAAALLLNEMTHNKGKMIYLSVSTLGAVGSECRIGVLSSNVNNCRITFVSSAGDADI